MPSDSEWPSGGIIMRVKVDITSGVLSLINPSALINPGIAGWNPSGLVGSIWVNNTQQTTISFNQTTRAMSASTVTVSATDTVEIRWEKTSGVNVEPWDNTVIMRRSAFFTVPVGDATFIFNQVGNAMPVPAWLLTFGWDASDDDTLKLTYKVINDGSATQDMLVTTQRINPTQNVSSTTIDLDSTSPQSHSAAFKKADVGAGKFQIVMLLKSGTGTTRMEESVVMTFNDKDDVPTYAGSFPGDVLLECTAVQGGIRLAEPW